MAVDDAGRRAMLARLNAQADVLHRHYLATKNPLFAWEAVRLFARFASRWPVPYPPWVNAYLGTAANTLIDLAEGIDPKAMPVLPARDATDAQIKEYLRNVHAEEERRTLDNKQANGRALHALGFRSRQGINVFARYSAALRAQSDADLASIKEKQHRVDVMTERRKDTFVESEAERTRLDASVVAKRLKAGKESLALGRIDPKNQWGPEPARHWKQIFGKK